MPGGQQPGCGGEDMRPPVAVGHTTPAWGPGRPATARQLRPPVDFRLLVWLAWRPLASGFSSLRPGGIWPGQSGEQL